MAQLERSERSFRFKRTTFSTNRSHPDWWSFGGEANGKGSGGTVNWNPTETLAFPGKNPCASLYHEMAHLGDFDKGTYRDDNSGRM